MYQLLIMKHDLLKMWFYLIFSLLSSLRLVRSVTTTSSTAPSAGSTGSWAEAETADRWPRSCCRSTARAGPKTAPSWSERARRLSETTPSPSGQ